MHQPLAFLACQCPAMSCANAPLENSAAPASYCDGSSGILIGLARSQEARLALMTLLECAAPPLTRPSRFFFSHDFYSQINS